MATAMKRRRTKAASPATRYGKRPTGRGTGKGPEVNGVGVYVAGVKKIALAKTKMITAEALLVYDPKQEAWHAGYCVDLGLHNRRSNFPNADGVSYGSRTKALADIGRKIRAILLGESEFGVAAKKAQCTRAVAELDCMVASHTDAKRAVTRAKRLAASPATRSRAQWVEAIKAEGGSTALVPSPQSEAMSPDETETLHGCEETIRQNLSGFLEVGNALATIQRGRLYRTKYTRFEDYCRAEWDFGKSYAHKLIHGADVVKQLEVSPIVSAGKNGHAKRSDLPDQLIILPQTESQVRPLTRLQNPLDRITAWAKALKSAPRGADNVPRVTAEIVERVVREQIGEPARAKDEGSRMKGEGRPRNPEIPAMSAGDGMVFNRELDDLRAVVRALAKTWQQPHCRERLAAVLRQLAAEAGGEG